MFEVIERAGEYTLADQKKRQGVTYQQYEEALEVLLTTWKNGNTPYLSLLIDPVFESLLLAEGFTKTSEIVEHERSLAERGTKLPTQPYKTLSASTYSDEEFGEMYDACRSGSANKNQLFSIEQILASLQLELGEGWRELVLLFHEGEEVIGLAIPHIEAGTEAEGRLFYFGILPKWRGKGKTTACHGAALQKLQELGATTYVGSTDVANDAMIHVMTKNGAHQRDRKGIYKLMRKDLQRE